MATVVDLIATMLKREGVQYLFGIPGGGGSIDLLDATEREGIRFILNSHETAAAIMACVVAELTGIPGVVLTAIAPGVTNVANGVAYAYLERAPLLVLSDNYPWSAIQVVLRQTLNHRQIFQGITKWTASLSAEWAHETLQRALRTTLEDRPGPVQLDLPDDVAQYRRRIRRRTEGGIAFQHTHRHRGSDRSQPVSRAVRHDSRAIGSADAAKRSGKKTGLESLPFSE